MNTKPKPMTLRERLHKLSQQKRSATVDYTSGILELGHILDDALDQLDEMAASIERAREITADIRGMAIWTSEELEGLEEHENTLIALLARYEGRDE